MMEVPEMLPVAAGERIPKVRNVFSFEADAVGARAFAIGDVQLATAKARPILPRHKIR
jgi:hypothetical protein